MSSQLSPVGGKHTPINVATPFTVSGIGTHCRPKLEQSWVHKEKLVGVVSEGLVVKGFSVGDVVKGVLLVGRGVVMGAEVETAARKKY